MQVEVIQGYLDMLKEAELVSLTIDQKNAIFKRYNTYPDFLYAVLEEENYFLMQIGKDEFRSIEYYLGFEYIRDSIIFKFECIEGVFIAYEIDDRVDCLIQTIQDVQEG